ncbi:MAG: transcription termination/antitermination NusG family protein [Chloroflexota bacterium]
MDVESWYVARTKMHREVATAHVLAQRGLDVYLPLLPPSSRPRARTVVREPLFPGYLFARLDVYSNAWLSARSAPGIVYFLGGDEAPTAVPDELIEEIRARAEGGSFAQRRPKFVPGQTVVIRHGPFSGLEAIFDSNQSGRGRVRVLLEIVQRLVPVDLHIDEIASISPEAATV